MSEEKKRSVTITIKDLPDELNEEELEKVAGGVLAPQQLATILKAQLVRGAISPGSLAGKDQYCDCWSYTACKSGMGGIQER
jgi:hypothetical protein